MLTGAATGMATAKSQREKFYGGLKYRSSYIVVITEGEGGGFLTGVGRRKEGGGASGGEGKGVMGRGG